MKAERMSPAPHRQGVASPMSTRETTAPSHGPARLAKKVIAVVGALLLGGCTPGALAGLQTAQTVVDTAAVVRARQLGLCAETPAPVTVASPDDALARQREIAELQRQLSAQQAALSAILAEMARRAAAPPPPAPSGSAP